VISGDEARALGEEICGWLAPGCLSILVVGSARRGAAQCHDLEIVVVPRVTVLPRIGMEPERVSELDARVDACIARGRWQRDGKVKRWGDRLKRLWVPSVGLAVELYITRTGNFGNIVAIRTGNQDFSMALVTKRRQGGLLPDGLYHRFGHLWDYVPADNERLMLTTPPKPPLNCPTEEAFFAALGFPWVPHPEMRDAVGVKSWRGWFARQARAVVAG